ncbi:hypothetical protein ACFOOM_01155 [Streptomyces echinoruber]|uniref:Uncharacterized protein n=2 Tax=Streptomyces echinoruber TaxID=68898 RepID=A0A918QUW9_9ACTN|nr:hypothetical protein GCM10010389_08020 [Streptomyces echinoruber]
MRREGGVFVCGKCGASFDPGSNRRVVAAGVIRRAPRGRVLRLVATAIGVAGSLRPAGAPR